MKPQQSTMFNSGADLPLFSQTPQTVNTPEPFKPDALAEELKQRYLWDMRFRFGDYVERAADVVSYQYTPATKGFPPTMEYKTEDGGQHCDSGDVAEIFNALFKYQAKRALQLQYDLADLRAETQTK